MTSIARHPHAIAQRYRLILSVLMSIIFAHAAGLTAAHASDISAKAVKAAVKDDFVQAFKLAQKSGDPVTQKTVEWYFIRGRSGEAGYHRIMKFIEENPHWPLRTSILTNVERILAKRETPLELVEAHFPKYAPVSEFGHIARARYAFLKGDKARSRQHIINAWYDPKLSLKMEQEIERRFKSVLKRKDYETRLWKLIHAQKTRSGVRFAKKISSKHLRAARAARQLIRVQAAGVKSYNALPTTMRNQLALRYAMARYHRKKGRHSKAREMLLAIPSAHEKQFDPDQWWIEKRLNIRNVVTPKNKKAFPELYRLAASHGYASGKEYIQGEFLAGWLALRKLGQPKKALPHFTNIAQKGKTRTDRSRGFYWLGRAHEALGDKKTARAAYEEGAKSHTLYYGLLAREKLGLGRKPVPILKTKIASADRKAIQKNELVRAFGMLGDAQQTRRMASFIWPMARQFKSASQHAAVAELVRKQGGIAMSVRYAKAAGRYGYDIDDWGYPTDALPKWRKIGPKVEKAMVYGLSRQESEFHPGARSTASAQGLMQILPSTGKLIARQYKIKYSRSKLTNPKYNVMLGAAHLGDLVNDFDGSYILAFVGYNAGPRRSREWTEMYGDLRDPNVDPIDWVEKIPFTETRNYVQKVLQNIHVYRSRLGRHKLVGMSEDLQRGRRGRKQALGRIGQCGTGARSLKALISSC